MDDRHNREVLGIGFRETFWHAEHLHDRALHGVLFDVHHLRLQASHLGGRHALLNAIAIGGRDTHADAAFGFAGTNHRKVEVDRLRRRIEAVRLGFDLGIEFVFREIVRKTDRLGLRQHRRHAEHDFLRADASLAERALQRDTHGLDVDHVAIGNGVAIQQFAGAFFQPEVVSACPDGQLHDLDARRPNIYADRSPA